MLGKLTSERKRIAAIANGKLGGRLNTHGGFERYSNGKLKPTLDQRLARREHDRANMAVLIAKAKAWRLANPAKAKEMDEKRHRKYYRQNCERIKLYQKQLYRKSPKRRTDIRQAKWRRRALELGAPVGEVKIISQWQIQWQSKRHAKCFWCGEKVLSKDCHTDHIVPLAKGGAHAIENVCISCEPCNRRKNAKLPVEWNKLLTQPALL